MTSTDLLAFSRSERDVARYLNISIETVRRLRYKDRGPRWRRIGSQVRYCLADVMKWCEAQPGGGQSKTDAT